MDTLRFVVTARIMSIIRIISCAVAQGRHVKGEGHGDQEEHRLDPAVHLALARHDALDVVGAQHQQGDREQHDGDQVEILGLEHAEQCEREGKRDARHESDLRLRRFGPHGRPIYNGCSKKNYNG